MFNPNDEKYKAQYIKGDKEGNQKRRIEVHAQFRKDIEEEYGTAGHPKAQRLFDIAWDLGHGSGLYEVDLHYNDLVDLIR